MSIGAQDNIERELVFKYANIKVDNSETARWTDPETVLREMTDKANRERDMIDMVKKLREKCTMAISPSIKYTRINFNPPKRR